ncbi:MAG TPA: nucleotide exchange factor GrpE [Solirubrobacteraceae bacterium]|jgi:molecular chaperone GrpE|nr:nucleotide exchange factor GrpE [Solirubrobacteraceae bacterium]
MTEIKITTAGQPGSPSAAGAAGPSTDAAGSGAGVPDSFSDGLPTSVAGAGAASAAAKALEGAHAQAAADVDEAAEIEGELDELVKTARQRDDYLALAQRTQADFENYRKRVARETAAARDRGVGSLAKELLPALDNLDRALDGAAEDDPLLQGVRLVRNELKAALSRTGIQSFCPLGEPFDPEVHEAVATAEQAPGGSPSGTVVEVYQDGYRLGDGVLRPARVVVAA